MTPDKDNRSIPDLFSDLVQQLSTLVLTEGRLLRSELGKSAHKVGNGAMEVVAGALLLLAAMMVLLQALITALAKWGLDPAWASLLVGIVVAVIGTILVKRGTANMSPSELAPSRTSEQLRKDVALAKEQTR
jgi:xanthine/uracil permease